MHIAFWYQNNTSCMSSRLRQTVKMCVTSWKLSCITQCNIQWTIDQTNKLISTRRRPSLANYAHTLLGLQYSCCIHRNLCERGIITVALFPTLFLKMETRLNHKVIADYEYIQVHAMSRFVPHKHDFPCMSVTCSYIGKVSPHLLLVASESCMTFWTTEVIRFYNNQ